MKKILIFWITAVFLSLIACEKEKPAPTPPSIPEIKLEIATLQIQMGETKTIAIQGGNGEYTFSQKGDGLLEFKVENKQLHIKATKVGMVDVTIQSGDKKAMLKVQVTEIPPKKLSEVGVFNAQGEPLFTINFKYQTAAETYFSPSFSPAQKHMKIYLSERGTFLRAIRYK